MNTNTKTTPLADNKSVAVKMGLPEIDGTVDNTLWLKKDINVLCIVEQETGLNLFKAISGGEMTLNRLRGVLYAALKTAHAVTLEEVGELISRPDFVLLLPALSEAMGWSQDPTLADAILDLKAFLNKYDSIAELADVASASRALFAANEPKEEAAPAN